MQVTGSNISNDKVLSIRVSPDGLYFWYAKGEPKLIVFSREDNYRDEIALALKYIVGVERQFESVRYYEDTLRTILVPAEHFDESLIGEYLKLNNVEVKEGEGVAAVAARQDVFAILPYNKETTEFIGQLLGREVSVGSLFELDFALSATLAAEGHNCIITLTKANVYITVFDCGQMIYADVLKWKKGEDILFYLKNIEKTFGLSDLSLYVGGPDTQQMCRYMRKVYKNVTCV